MREGRIEQVGRPRDIYRRPRSRFVAEFLGGANLIEGVVERRDAGGSYSVTTSEGWVRASDGGSFSAGVSVVVAIRSEDIRIEPAHSEDGRPNHWAGTVRAQAFRGDAVDHVVDVGAAELKVRVPVALALAPGTEVTLTFGADACLLLPSDDR
jgi:iron(III) transport system ATP-binding protein